MNMNVQSLNWGFSPALGEHRVLHAGKWRPARSIGWMVFLIFAIMLVFGPTVEALSHVLPARQPVRFFLKVFGAALVLGTYAILVRFGEDRPPNELAISAAPVGLLAGLLIGFVMFAVVMAIALVFGLYDVTYQGPASAWRAVGLALESGVLEEVLVRGVVLRLVWRAFGPAWGFAVSAILFGVGHIANPSATLFTTACVAIEAGIMLGSFYALTGRLWVSIGVHAGWNFTQGYVFGAAVSGGNFGSSIAVSQARKSLPNWLTGGGFGPEASAPALIVCTFVGAAVLWMAWKADRFAIPPAAAKPTSAQTPYSRRCARSKERQC